jgi:HSP20 family protein
MIFTRLQTPGYAAVSRAVTLHNELRNLFEQALGGGWERPYDPADGFLPALDLHENKDSFVVKVELPGVKKEDVAISLENGVLAISGERKQDPQLDSATVCRCERALGRFERKVGLPAKVDADKIHAAYADGILTVTLPKAEEAKPKQIAINVN